MNALARSDLMSRTDSYRVSHTLDPRVQPRSEFYQSMQLMGRSYPRIFKRISNGWGTQPLHDYLTFMMIGDADHRAGFPVDVANAIMTITLMHSSKFSYLITKPEVQLKAIFRKHRW